MRIHYILLGGIGMYLYLRSRGIKPPHPKLLEWEQQIKLLAAKGGR